MRNASHRIWPCIAVAVAVAVIAPPATSAGVHNYNTRVGFGWDPGGRAVGVVHAGLHGIQSKVRKCMRGRRVTLFKQRPWGRPGSDREIAHDRSNYSRIDRLGGFWMPVPDGTFHKGDRLYVTVKRKVLNDGDVCSGARSKTKTAR
jgi:hypothetical protein